MTRRTMLKSCHHRLLIAAAMVGASVVALAANVSVAASPGSWSSAGSMYTPRISHTATRLANERVLVTGGITPGPATTATAELFDPGTSSWSPTASMHVPRSRHVAVLLEDGRVLVAGGRGADGVATASAEIYDPPTDQWTLTAPMSVARDNFTATLLGDGRVLVAGGVGAGTVQKSAEIYDPQLAKWQSGGEMARRRFNHAAVRLADGRVLVAGGAGAAGDCVYSQTAEIFNPSTTDWHAVDPMTTPRGLPALHLLPDGNVLTAGGLTSPADCRLGFNATDSAEIYEPGFDRWTPTASMSTPRRMFGNAQLKDRSVLVAGGRDDAGALLDSAELYDPVDHTWTSAGSMAAARVGVILTTLADGRVLATGGGAPIPLSAAELYTPR